MVSMLLSSIAWAQDCQPSGKYTDANGETNTIAAGDTYVGSAPLTIAFSANPPTTRDAATHYEWHFFNQNNHVRLSLSVMMRIPNTPLQRQEQRELCFMKS